VEKTARVAAACAATAWGSALVAGALWLKYAPPDPETWVGRASASEPLHIVAHAILYGVLAALAWIATRRWWTSALVVALFAVAQEAAQTVWWGRGFGPAEWFDFGVDAAAVAIVLVVVPRAGRPSEPRPAS
jgi:hypothetical protein